MQSHIIFKHSGFLNITKEPYKHVGPVTQPHTFPFHGKVVNVDF